MVTFNFFLYLECIIYIIRLINNSYKLHASILKLNGLEENVANIVQRMEKETGKLL